MSEKDTHNVVTKYRIGGIKEHHAFPGYVAVLLEPLSKLKPSSKKPKSNLHTIAPKGFPIPPQVLQQVKMEVEETLDRMNESEMIRTDPRTIIHMEPILDFVARNWKYGDIVEITIEKIKDVAERDPLEIEQSD